MNEAQTRLDYIDPKLKDSGWGKENTRIIAEHPITAGRILIGGRRSQPKKADYVLEYNGKKVAVVEAKRVDLHVTEGLEQAKEYGKLLHIDNVYSTNGKEIYEFSLKTGHGQIVKNFPTPDEVWEKAFGDHEEWKQIFHRIPFDRTGGFEPRYYQENAVNKTLNAIAEDKNRILLTLATGTGKTYISFQIAWKLFQSRWNVQRDKKRRPRILFLADRNILADQAINSFPAFPDDALVRVTPSEIRKRGDVPMNGSIFFAIFQTFMSGDEQPFYQNYPVDYFDFVIIDECHRGGANDEGNWHKILEYFSSATHLGLTATPKRKDNVDTYKYFGDPIYQYSLAQGVDDGFLTPFKVKRIQTTLDEFVYSPDDEVVQGEPEQGHVYEEADFNKIIEIEAREKKRVKIFMEEINQNEKGIVFCANQPHALQIRDMINEIKDSSHPDYCVRVTANDGARGETFLKQFQDNENTVPTILTTSQKLSTGVNARNIRNIILLRPINSIIEFKQIVGRGTRLFEGKEYFTIYDFVGAYKNFSDPEWDGEPIDKIINKRPKHPSDPEDEPEGPGGDPSPRPEKIKIKLSDGKEREIQHMISTSFWGTGGKPISAEEFLKNMFGVLPDFFRNEEELRVIWSNPKTRKNLLEQLAEVGYDQKQLESLQKVIRAENSDLFDVLEYVAFAKKPISREKRVQGAERVICLDLNDKENDFLNFVLNKYKKDGATVLDEEKLSKLIEIRYHSVIDAQRELGSISKIRNLFFEMQTKLYAEQ